jgi:hypothetical protein
MAAWPLAVHHLVGVIICHPVVKHRCWNEIMNTADEDEATSAAK